MKEKGEEERKEVNEITSLSNSKAFLKPQYETFSCADASRALKSFKPCLLFAYLLFENAWT